MRSEALTAALAALVLCFGCGSVDEPTITESDVVVSTNQMDVTFSRQGPFTDTYMVFGGLASTRADMISKVSVVGLSMEDARPIHARYPDFHECKSAGAPLAQRATRQMDIVPANAEVFEQLQETLDAHEKSLRQGGERVCVQLRGDLLELTSATVEDQDITSQLPPQMMHEYYLVQSAQLVDARSALGGS